MDPSTPERAARMTEGAAYDVDDALCRLIATATALRASIRDGYLYLGADGDLTEATKRARETVESLRSVERVSSDVPGFTSDAPVKRHEAARKGAARSARGRGRHT